VWKGDATVACIAAASILAKVTRDAIMTGLHDRWPDYEFGQHKGYITPGHEAALSARGPCPEHRRRYVNVRRALGERVDAAPDDNDEVDAVFVDVDPVAPVDAGRPLGETA
jgi:ribonuclease HII